MAPPAAHVKRDAGGVATVWAASTSFALTNVSACTAELITYPIDFVKVRMQLQGEAGVVGSAGGASVKQQRSHVGPARMLLRIVQLEGVTGLYAGATPALIRHIPYSGTRIGVYEALRSLYDRQGNAPDVVERAKEGPGLAVKMLMGATAGAVGKR